MKILNTKIPYECPLFRVEEREVELNGKVETHFVIVRLPNVMTIGLTKDKKIAFIKEIVGKNDIEFIYIPGGKMNSFDPTNEEALEQGLVELEEETGFTTNNAELLYIDEEANNWLEFKRFYVVAWDIEPVKQRVKVDTAESIDLFLRSIPEAEELGNGEVLSKSERGALKEALKFFKDRGLI